jgi:hypothetical protein
MIEHDVDAASLATTPERSLWPVPLLAALLPVAAMAIAYPLSIDLDLAPACNPFLEGCVSISRAGRHGLPNIVFRGLLLPAAVLQATSWLLCPAWLRTLGAAPDRLQRALPALGVAAAVMLVLYGTFLGTEGEGYRWMRRYGVIFYFGLTGIATLVASDGMLRLLRAGPRERRVALVVCAPCMALPLLGLAYVLLPLWWSAPAEKNAVENIAEWWAGAIFTAFFLGLAWAWRRTRFRAQLLGSVT